MKYLVSALMLAPLWAHTSVEILDSASERTVSPMLNGMHQVYSYASDDLYKDGAIAQWAKSSNIPNCRFPGGTIVKFWDWESPTGLRFSKEVRSDLHRWDPEWKPEYQVPASQWMSLDEHLDFLKKAQMKTPILGVNLISGIRYEKEQEAIDKAVRMAEYVKSKGYEGAWYYLGNEEVHMHAEEGSFPVRIAAYAQRFARYARALKAVDPTCKTFWNLNEVTPKTLAVFLENDEGTSDGVETHGKYPYYSNNEDHPLVSFEDWQQQFPLQHLKPYDTYTWRNKADQLRARATAMGRLGYLVTDFEWGWHGHRARGFNGYTQSLALIELGMELIIGGYDASCYWDTQIGYGLFDYQNRPRAHALAMAMLSSALGETYLEIQTTNPQVHGFAVQKAKTAEMFLINKSSLPVSLSVSKGEKTYAILKGEVIRNAGDNRFGEQKELLIHEGKVTLPPLSFARLVLR